MREGAYLLTKRSIDILGAAIGLVLSSPVFLLIALAVTIADRGPVFYRQERIGYEGKPFGLLKFRSMRVDAEAVLRADPELWKLWVASDFKLPEGQDPRVTPVGVWLRKSSLDELPQLWNVLTGDMSLVGPRPKEREEVEAWYQGRERELLSMRPGITGLWQVYGRSEVTYPERADLELSYARDQSLTRDIRILFRTVGVVMGRRGAH